MRETLKTYMQPAFLICAAALAIGGGGMSIAIKSFGLYLKKEPLPLSKSLDFFSQNGLAPYKVLSKEKILNEDVLKSLVQTIIFNGSLKTQMQAWTVLFVNVYSSSPITGFQTVCPTYRRSAMPAAAASSWRQAA